MTAPRLGSATVSSTGIRIPHGRNACPRVSNGDLDHVELAQILDHLEDTSGTISGLGSFGWRWWVEGPGDGRRESRESLGDDSNDASSLRVGPPGRSRASRSPRASRSITSRWPASWPASTPSFPPASPPPTSWRARASTSGAETGGANWYYVEMKSDAPCFAGILPKPKKDLIGKKVFYYLNAFDKDSTDTRTPDITAEVVSNERECKKDVPVAPFVNNASVAGVPELARGLRRRGPGTAAVVGIVAGGAAVVGGGIAVASSGGNDDHHHHDRDARVDRTRRRPPPRPPTTTTTVPGVEPPLPADFRINPRPRHGRRAAPRGVQHVREPRREPAVHLRLQRRRRRGLPRPLPRRAHLHDEHDLGLGVGPLRHPAADQTYNSVMRVFEVSETARPPTNDAHQVNAVTVTGPSTVGDLRRPWPAGRRARARARRPRPRAGSASRASSTCRAAAARWW